MRKFAVLALAALALAACDLPDPPQQQSSQHGWQDAQIGSRIRSPSATATGDSGTTTDTTFLRNIQRAGQTCAGSACGN
jgi:hypothetical protein